MTPSSAALTGVPSGTARLMPSFCRPLDFGPKPAMTRPRTGQRNPATAPAGSAALTAVSWTGGAAAGVATRALRGDSVVATFWVLGRAAVAAGASARGAGGAAGAAAVAGPRAPGTTMRSPTFTRVFGEMLFAFASIITGLP